MRDSSRRALDGDDWERKPFLGLDWLMRRSHLPDTRDHRGWGSGSVPGSVVNDLWAHGEIPDPYQDRNSELCEWTAQRTWVYRKNFTVPDDWRWRRVHLCFEGVDYEAQFFLNGEKLGHHRSMYTPVFFEVGDHLRYGDNNLLAVVIEPAPVEQPQVGRTSLVRTHKSRMTYWWDFCPRLVHQGIWDSVYLLTTGPARLLDVWVRSELNDDFTQAEITVQITADVSASAEVVLLHDGAEIARQLINTGQAAVFTIDHPAQWWPNGHGEQSLYEAMVTLLDPATGAESDSRMVTFGIRRLEFVPNDTPDTTARPYTMVVNGRKIYIKGWNWVPLDVLYGVERPEKLEHLLRLAQQANVNLLRVWGGGLIEKEAFYNLCDWFGILVWQEFIQSSSGIDNNPPNDPDFIAWMENEARQIIPRKRNHPSLALWCGGNELTSGPEMPLDESHPMLNMLRRVVNELDPGRMWLPTSPSGRVFSNNLSIIEQDPLAQHDVHGPWEHQGLTGQYTLYNRATSLLHSEFGAEGLTNLKTLEATISEPDRWPVTLDNPTWFHRGAWWVKDWHESLGEVDRLEKLVQGTQFFQAESVRYAVEANRSRKYHNSGSLPWQFNEPYPMAACTSAVDYFGHPKPLYYAVKRAYAPLLVAARLASLSWVDQPTFEADLWCANSYPDMQDAHLRARVIGPNGEIYAVLDQPVILAENAVTFAERLRLSLMDVAPVFFLDLSLTDHSGTILATNRYLFTRESNLAAALNWSAANITADIIRESERWSILVSNPGTQTALWMWLEDARPRRAEGCLYFSDNYFCLLPGEKREIGVNWNNIPLDERQITISGWNIAAMTV